MVPQGRGKYHYSCSCSCSYSCSYFDNSFENVVSTAADKTRYCYWDLGPDSGIPSLWGYFCENDYHAYDFLLVHCSDYCYYDCYCDCYYYYYFFAYYSYALHQNLGLSFQVDYSVKYAAVRVLLYLQGEGS